MDIYEKEIDQRLIEQVTASYLSVREILFLRKLTLLYEKAEKKSFKIKIIDDAVSLALQRDEYIPKFETLKLINITHKGYFIDHDENDVGYHECMVKPLVNLQEEYKKKLNIFEVKPHEMTLMKQCNEVYKLISEISNKLQKNKLDISYGAILDYIQHFDIYNINLYIALLKLENNKKLIINNIARGDGLICKQLSNGKFIKTYNSLTFNIDFYQQILYGDNYFIDLINCELKFDDGKIYPFKRNSQTYKFFELFAHKKALDVNDISSICKFKNTYSDRKSDTRRIRYRVRTNLKIKDGSEHDIFVVKDGITTLRGLN